MNATLFFATITLAPAIDSVAEIVTGTSGEAATLTPGAVHGVRGGEGGVAGGKGINVAKLLARHGCAVAAGGFLGEGNAEPFTAMLSSSGIADRFVRVPGKTRRNLMLIDACGEYKLNRPAFPDMAYRRHAVACAVEAAVAGADVAIFSGSLPSRFPCDAYAALIPVARRHGCAIVLDTSGNALAAATKAAPDVIKPNRHEAETLLGRSLDTPTALRHACETLMRHHETVILSDGKHGAYFASRGAVWRVTAPPVTPLDTTAAGDMMLAEFCFRYFPRRRLTETVLRHAVAAGAAATLFPASACPSLSRIASLAPACQLFKMP